MGAQVAAREAERLRASPSARVPWMRPADERDVRRIGEPVDMNALAFDSGRRTKGTSAARAGPFGTGGASSLGRRSNTYHAGRPRSQTPGRGASFCRAPIG